MKKICTLLMACFSLANLAKAQYTVTINVSDLNGCAPLENVEVVLDGNFFANTDASGNAVFTDIADGEYFYSTSLACYTENGASVMVSGSDVQTGIALEAATSNSVFFFVGSPLTIPGASVVVTGDEFFQELTTGAPFGDVMENVPFGDYSYSITAPCYELITGTFTVDCTDGNGIVVSAEPVPSTSNSVFFFVGSPLTIPGASVVVTGDEFFQELTTGAPFGDVMENVPFGNYSYSITAPCYELITGTFTVDCTDGNGIVVSAEPVPSTSNNVFFYVGSPLSISGATVSVTGNGFSQELVTGAPFGDVMENVPFGDYSYTINANCYETVSGTFTVDCANGDGIAVSEEPAEIIIDNSVTQTGALLEANESGGSYLYQWVDCDNDNEPVLGATSSSFTATQNGSYAVVITNDNCSVTSECYSVTGVGINSMQAEKILGVFPNPFTSVVNIDLARENEISTLEVYSVAGQLVYSEKMNPVKLFQVDLSNLNNGVYMVLIKNSKGVYRAPVQKR